MQKFSRALKYFAIIIFLLGFMLAFFKYRSQEDNWICQNGKWIKHGNPNTPMPEFGCGEENEEGI